MDSKISSRIRVLNFFMVCFIVLSHVGTPGNDMAQNKIDMRLNTLFGGMVGVTSGLRMTFFFSVTGYLLMRRMSFENYPKKIKRRVNTLLVPYIVWQRTYLVYLYATGIGYPVKEIIKSVFLFGKFPPLGPLWYIYVAFFLALFSPVFILLYRNKNIGAVAIAFIVIGLTWMKKTENPLVSRITHYGFVGNIVHYMPAFVTGSYFGKFRDSMEKSEMAEKGLCIALFLMLFEGLFSGIQADSLIAFLPLVMLYAFPVERLEKFAGISKISFMVYALHIPVLSATCSSVRKVFYAITPYVFVNNIGTRLVCLAITIGVAVLIYTVLAKISKPLLRLYTGGRG